MDVVVVTGPTATGKTRLAVALARHFNGEIISADSRQVYRGMDIGTGKDLDEYGHVPYHLIDIVSPREEYNLKHFLVDAAAALKDIRNRGRLAFVVGGSPLYVHALITDYELPGGGHDAAFRSTLSSIPTAELASRLAERHPQVCRRTDLSQRKRIVRALEIAESGNTTDIHRHRLPPLRTLILAPYYTRQEVHRRIETRLRERLRQGLLEEVRRLHDEGVSWKRLDDLGLEYRYAARHLLGSIDKRQFFAKLFTQIRRFCKSQDIWFRKMEREGQVIHWLPQGDLETARGLVHRFLAGGSMPRPTIRISEILYGPRSQ